MVIYTIWYGMFFIPVKIKTQAYLCQEVLCQMGGGKVDPIKIERLVELFLIF